MQAFKESAPKSVKEKNVKRTQPSYNNQKKLNTFKNKFENSNLTIEEFIKQNEIEFRNIALMLKNAMRVIGKKN